MSRRLAAFLLLVFVAAGVSSAGVIVDKTPDQGPYWEPLGPVEATPIYANSFVFAGGSEDLLTKLGVYLSLYTGTEGSEFRLQLLADSSNSPDLSTVLAQTAILQASNTDLELISADVLAPVALTAGTRYWIAANTVGLEGAGDYQVGAHTPGSDGGTFWYSNNGTTFDGQRLTPEMAIYAEASGASVPEPGTCLALFAGLIALAVARRKLA